VKLIGDLSSDMAGQYSSKNPGGLGGGASNTWLVETVLEVLTILPI
jgi:hypothetical protein